MSSGLTELFVAYKDAFDSLDEQAISDCYSLPCLTSDGDGVAVFLQADQLLQKFALNCESLKHRGYRASSYEMSEVIVAEPALKAIKLAWRVQFDQEVIEFACLYNCVRHENGWKISSAYVY